MRLERREHILYALRNEELSLQFNGLLAKKEALIVA